MHSGVYAATVIEDSGRDSLIVDTFGGRYRLDRSCIFETFFDALTNHGQWTAQEKEWAKHFLQGSTYIPSKWSDQDIAQARESLSQIRDALIVPREIDPLDRCGIRKEEITPDTVIVITHPIDCPRAELDSYAKSIVSLTGRPVVLVPEVCKLETMPLAELLKLREQLNGIIYDLERASL